MAQVHVHIPSFNAGELSPLLGARFAVEKVQSGCRRLRNFIPHVHGPAFRRPGMEYIGASAGDGARSSLRGFNFSTTTGFILEFHPNGLQIWSNGVKVPLRTPVPLPYSEAECGELQTAQVNDVSYIVHPNHLPRRLVRYADDDWRLEAINWKWPALGDENVRSTEISTPAVTLLREVDTNQWPEFIIPTGATYTFNIVNPNLTTNVTKTAKIWEWLVATTGKGAWKLRKSISWTTVATGTGRFPFTAATVTPETFWKMEYTAGPAGVAGSKLTAAWAGGSAETPLDDLQIIASKPYPASMKPVTVPAGDWQMTVDCALIPEGASLIVQKSKTSTAGVKSWNLYKKLELRPNLVLVTRGEKLEEASEFRFFWTGRAMFGTASIESVAYPISKDIVLQCNSISGTGRTLTASIPNADPDEDSTPAPIFRVGHIGSFWQIAHRRDSSYAEIVATTGAYPAEESSAIRVSGKWDVFTYGSWDGALLLERKVSGVWEVARTWTSRKDRNIIANGEEEAEIEMRLRIIAGNGSAASGAAVPRFILETADGRVYGIVKITAVGTLNADGKSSTATVDIISPLFSTEETPIWSEGAWSGVNGYPRAVSLHGQRLWFGGTKSEPLRLWGSVVNDFENFRTSSLDDASVSFVPAAQQANALQWMVSHGENLVLGTNGDEWTISGGTERGPITPTSVLMQRRSGYGSRFLAALLLGEMIVFVQRGGKKLRAAAPKQDGLVWQATDMTVLAEHIAREGVVQIGAMYFPQTILWAVTATGKLLGMTFEQEQNVFAWHVHETQGFVESVAVVFGVESDQVWLTVRRDGKRMVERLDPHVFALEFSDHQRLIYSDSGKRVEAVAPFTQITGLGHLEGKDVVIMGDGAELPPARVVNGAVTLEAPVSVAVVGLPFTSEFQPMRIDIPLRDGTAQHRQWRVSRVGLFLHESLGGEVSDGPGRRFERLNFRNAGTPTDSAPPLYSGEVETAIESSTRTGVDVVVRTSGPLPFNVGSMTLKLDVYGE